ncbi:MAG: hypothetical protein HY904_20325 [Deltaproteobacteria bacterium]|nr:hypothetical protein [Deltaproteobacteria bacterium]
MAPAPPAPVAAPPAAPPPPPAGKFQAVAHALPVAPLVDALQREAFPGPLCISAYSPAGMENADAPLASALEGVLQLQKGVPATKILADRNADETTVLQAARTAGCAHLLRVTAFPAEPGAPLRVLFSLRDLDGDEMVTTVSTRCLARITDVAAAGPEAQGALEGMDLRSHVDRDKLATFRKRALRLSGTETDGWTVPIIQDNGLRVLSDQLRRMTDDPEASANFARFDRETEERSVKANRSFLVALAGPAVGLVGGVVAGLLGAGVGALYFVSAGVPALLGAAAVGGVCGFLCVGTLSSLAWTGCLGLGARLIAELALPRPTEPLTLDVARRLVVEANMRSAQDLEIDHEDLPSRYLPLERPKDAIKDRLEKLQDVLEDAKEAGSSGDAVSVGGRP